MPRKPQSALLQVVNGNPNRRTKNQLNKRIKNEKAMATVPDDELKKVPSWLDKFGKSVYKRVVDTFSDTTLYNNADRDVIARYADLASEYHKAVKEEDTDYKLKIGKQLDSMADKLGLTPTSRLSLSISRKVDIKQEAIKEATEFDDFDEEMSQYD